MFFILSFLPPSIQSPAAVHSSPAKARKLPASVNAVSARHFVRTFYDWYVPRSFNEKGPWVMDLLITVKSGWLGPGLLTALRDDIRAQENPNAGGEVGLDFDAFLNAQDPPEHYHVGKYWHRGKRHFVDVRGVAAPRDNNGVRITVELEKRGPKWRIANILYPDRTENLLEILRVLKMQRIHDGTEPGYPARKRGGKT